MDLYWPSALCPTTSTLEVLDNTGRFQSPLSGFMRSVSRPGSRLRLSMQFRNLSDVRRASLQALFARVRGADRLWVPDHGYLQRGVFADAELLSNGDFSNGLTGWTMGSTFTGTVSDNVLRATLNASGSGAIVRNTTTVAVTPGVPYIFRAMIEPVASVFASIELRAGSSNGGNEYGATTYSSLGLLSHMFIPSGSVVSVTVLKADGSGHLPGDSLDISLMSVARCALVDNLLNALTRSDEFDHADWTKSNLTVSANVGTAPNGTTTSDRLVENGTNSTHFIRQNFTVPSAAGVDYGISFDVNANGRNFCQLILEEETSGTSVSQYFNVGSGTVGSGLTGANWSNRRASIRDLGAGWYRCQLFGTKTNGATLLQSRLVIATADGTNSFTGSGASALQVWRGGAGATGSPWYPSQTVATALASGALTLGGGLWTKGWDASLGDLLKKSDRVQIGTQLLLASGAVVSDANGRAFLPVSPVLRSIPANDTPIIVRQPMGKFMLEEPENGWNSLPKYFADAEVVLGEGS